MTSHSATILIVDDNASIRELLSLTLMSRGFAVDGAANGIQALEKLETRPFDLVLLDIMMPEMDGYELLEVLRQHETLSHLPVVVLSAVNDINSVIRCIELGAEDYLFKPIDSSLLWARLNALLEKKRLRDQEQARMAEIATMRQIDRELNATLDLRRAAEIALRWALGQTGAVGGLLGGLEENGLLIWAVKGVPDQVGATIPLRELAGNPGGNGRSDQVALTGGGRSGSGQFQITVTIERGDYLRGLLFLETAAPLSDGQRQFLVRLSDHAAIALANAQLYAMAESANQAKSDFVAAISRQLKPPTDAIGGQIDLLLDQLAGPLTDQQAEMLQAIKSNAGRIERLVADLAVVTQIKNGQLRLRRTAVELASIVDEVVQSLESEISASGLTINLMLDESLPPLYADRSRLAQIVRNLLANAIKYSPPGRSINVCAAVREQDERTMVTITVEDHGIGISEDEQPDIFTQFFRSQDSAVRQANGTGLGLAITRELVELHDGSIWFTSEHGQGSTFSFAIPAVVAVAAELTG